MPRPFQQSLAEGHRAEEAWVDELRSEQLSVAHGQRIVAEGFNPAVDHLQHPDAAGVFRIEIKNRGLHFTCPEDYPYPTVFLANMASSHRDMTSPLIYVIRSKSSGKWVWVISTDQNDSWTTSFKRDKTRNTNVHILECPSSFLRPPEQLRKLLMHHHVLDLIDGGTDAFRPASDRPAAGQDQRADRRKRGPKEETDKCLGRLLKNCKKKSQPCARQSKR